jgi:hypothetical protein
MPSHNHSLFVNHENKSTQDSSLQSWFWLTEKIAPMNHDQAQRYLRPHRRGDRVSHPRDCQAMTRKKTNLGALP